MTRKTVAQRRALANAERAAFLDEERREVARLVEHYRARRAERAAAAAPPAVAEPVSPTLSIAEQEQRYLRAIDPGRAMAQDIIAASIARIEAAPLTVAERAWVGAGLTWQDRSRRLGEVLAAEQSAEAKQRAADVATMQAKLAEYAALDATRAAAAALTSTTVEASHFHNCRSVSLPQLSKRLTSTTVEASHFHNCRSVRR